MALLELEDALLVHEVIGRTWFRGFVKTVFAHDLVQIGLFDRFEVGSLELDFLRPGKGHLALGYSLPNLSKDLLVPVLKQSVGL